MPAERSEHTPRGVSRRGFVTAAAAATAMGFLASQSSPLRAAADPAYNPSGTIQFHAWDADRLVASNWYADGQPVFVSDAAYPGGGYYRLETATASSTDSYVVTYAVEVPRSGLYDLRWSSTPPDVSWASPFAISVNGGAFGTVGSGGRFDQINSTVQCYDQGNIQLYDAATVASQEKGTLPSVVTLHNGLNTISFQVSAPRTLDGKYVMYLNSIALTPATNQVGSITPAAPLGVFTLSQTPAVTVSLTTPASVSTSVAVTVTDYWHNSVHQQSYPIAAGAQNASVSLGTLPVGNYQIQAVIAVVGATPTTSGPFGSDAALGELTDAAVLTDFVRAIQLAGVSRARERYNWTETNPSSGVYDYSEFQPVLDAYSAAGLDVLAVYGFAAGWTMSGTDLMPDDLRLVYDFAKNTASHSGSDVAVWEVWNEPDYGANTSPGETADRYAAFAKAAAFGYADSTSGAVVSSAGLAGRASSYASLLVANDMLSYVDVYAFHGYTYAYTATGPADYPFPTPLASSHSTLVRGANAGTSLWMTEAGIPIPKGSVDGALDPGSFAANPQRSAQARYAVTSAVESLAAGTDHHFWFAAPYFDEFGTLYGAFSVEMQPYPAYSAIAAMTRALGDAAFVAAATGLPAGVTGYWFDNGSHSVLVIWAGTQQTVSLAVAAGSVTVTSLMGSSTTSTSGGTLSLVVNPDPQFVTTARDHLAPSRPWAVIPSQPRARGLAAGKRIVLQPMFPDASRDYARIYGAYQLDTTSANTVQLNVYNFGTSSASVSLSSQSTGWTVAFAQTSVTVPAGGRVTVAATVTASSPASTATPLTFVSTVGGVTSTSVASVQPRMQNLPASLVAWSGSASSWGMWGIDGTVSDGPDAGEVRFSYRFGHQGGTAYPVIQVTNPAILSGAAGLVFRLWSASGIADTTLRVLAQQANGATYWTPTGYSIEAGWNEIIVPFDSFVFASFGGPDPSFQFAPTTVTYLRIGINTSLSTVPDIGIKQLGTYTL